METHLPALESNPLKQVGKKEQGTLWDQEKDELAVRILLEEGKLNLAFRLLHKFKEFQRTEQYNVKVKECSKRFGSDEDAVNDRCRIFEQSVGVLLRFALEHVEALQIIDLPQLIRHIAEVLSHAGRLEKEQKEKAKTKGSDLEKMQESLVLHYLACLALKMEEMDEDRVMDLLNEQNVISLLVDHMAKYSKWYRLDTLEAVCLFFNGVFNSEAYSGEPEKFVGTEELKKQFVTLKGDFIADLVSSHGLRKSEIESLWNALSEFEAEVGPAVIHSIGDIDEKEKAKVKA